MKHIRKVDFEVDLKSKERSFGLPPFKIKLQYNEDEWEELYKTYDKTVLLFLTSACNLRCENCFNDTHMSYSKNNLTVDYVEKVINSNPDIKKYDLMGGEPLIHKDINKIVSLLNTRGKKVNLYTNGKLLNRLSRSHRDLRVHISFHSLISEDSSRKPLTEIAEQIEEVSKIYPVKLVLLLDRFNSGIILESARYIEKRFKEIKRITIGSMRAEEDYWDDSIGSVLPLQDYINNVQTFVNCYKGRLNIDIFTKGVFYTQQLPTACLNQLNRFKCIYPNNKMTSCLYLVAGGDLVDFDPDKPIPYPSVDTCSRTGTKNCLADKIRLKRIR